MSLSRAEPLRRYTVGDKVFFTGTSWTHPNGDKLVHGKQGEVTGHANFEIGKGMAVLFPGNKGNIECFVTEVRRRRAAPAAKPMLMPHARDDASPNSFLLNGWCPRAQASRAAPPPLPGGYKMGEKVFFTGASQTVSTGDKLVHGQQGEVVGTATLETHKGKGVDVLFPGNKGWIDCYLTEVRRLRAAPADSPRLRRSGTRPIKPIMLNVHR